MFGIARPRYSSTSFSMKTSRCASMVARVVGLMAVMFLVLFCGVLNLGWWQAEDREAEPET